jgi:soluble lytic murein transglycosylase-like protein
MRRRAAWAKPRRNELDEVEFLSGKPAPASNAARIAARPMGTGSWVRRCSTFLLCAAVLFASTRQPSRADALTTLRRYAVTLEHFDARLDDAHAMQLALRTVAQASDYGLDARLVVALVAVESSWNPAAQSKAGARGLGQLMPGTATSLGVDPSDPDANLDGTIRHLGGLLRRYRALAPQARFERSIAAYNAGADAVDRYRGVPPYPETQAYVRRVIGLWRRLAGR